MNIIQNIQKQITTRSYLLNVFFIVFMYFTFFSCTQKDYLRQHEDLLAVENFLWQRDFVNAEELLNTIDTALLLEEDKMVWCLYNEHLHLQKLGNLIGDTTLPFILDFFIQKNMNRYTAHAYYLLGRIHTLKNEEGEGMLQFKRAEELLLKEPNLPKELLGELYYQMARCSGIAELLDETYFYSTKALPYAYETQTYRTLSECYKLMANVLNNKSDFDSISSSDVVNFYDSALYYYELTPNHHKGNFHIISFNKADYMHDTLGIFQHSKYLVDSLNFLPNAVFLIQHYIDVNNIDSALYYLKIFASDTTNTRRNTRWSLKQYKYYDAYCTLLKGEEYESAILFKTLYEDLENELKATEKTRTYAVSRRYDVEKEQRERLEVEVEKQQLWILLLIAIGGVAVLLLIFFVYRENDHRKHAQLAAQNELQAQRIEALNNELTLKRDSLRQKLLQRIELTRQLHLQEMKTNENQVIEQLPTWTQHFIESQLLLNEEISEALCKEFDALYYNMLSTLQREYPRFSQADKLMCVLIMLQIPITDVCVLLNVPKQTVWNRRNRIKEHIGLQNGVNIEEWLSEYAVLLVLKHTKNLQV